MASVSRQQALQAFRDATYHGLAWGALEPTLGTEVPGGRLPDPTEPRLCATALVLVQLYGRDVLEDRGVGLLFPRAERLRDALDVLGQMANWAEVYGFLPPGDGLVTERYAFNQQTVSTRARAWTDPLQLGDSQPKLS